jgi:predicted neutral ceramidase superfamily lipid hydrolase
LDAVVPLSIVASFLTYETLDYKKRDGKLSFHLKRFFGRVSLIAVFFVIFLVFVALLSSTSPTEDIATGGLVLASLTTAVILYVLTRSSKTKDLLSKLEKGEW